jgi:hypothetical protein
MKTTLLLTVIALTMPSFTTEMTSAEKIGRKTLTALKHASHAEFVMLYPSLTDFYKMMDAEADVYGNTLDDAKNEFALTYARKIIPAMHESFDRIIREGQELGIDWRTTEFVRVEGNEKVQAAFGSATLSIVFLSGGEEHRIIVDKAVIINGQWRVSQHARII